MKTIGKVLTTLILGGVGATLLMICVNLLPNDKMQNHITESVVVMETEGDYPQLMNGYISSRLDNFTDSIMLISATHRADVGLIERAMNIYRVLYEGKRPSEVLVAYGKGEDGYTLTSYARYWHGYQIVLKPLLMLFNYQEIRYINMYIQTLFIAGVAVLMWKKNLKWYILPYLIMIFSIVPASTALSLQFSSIFYIMEIALVILINWFERLSKNANRVLFFLIIGMVTSFFDLLTYPLVTFGVPIVIFLVMEKKDIFLHNLMKVIKYGFCWSVGYAGMWASKWIIASILLRKNVIIDAITAIFSRTSTDTSTAEFTRYEVVFKNFKTMFESPIKYVFLLFVLVVGLYILAKMIKDKKNYIGNLQYVIIACFPIVWYIVLANHSYVHFWFTYREVSIFIFTILVWLSKNAEECKKEV